MDWRKEPGHQEPRYWHSPLRWRHNGRDGVSNHQPHGCLLNRLFRRKSKKTSKLRVTGLCAGNLPWPVNSPHKRPVTRKMFPFDDVIMLCEIFWRPQHLKGHGYVDGLVQDCSNSSALAMELLQSCTKLPMCGVYDKWLCYTFFVSCRLA